MNTCSGCRYWLPGSYVGECRRFPPQIHVYVRTYEHSSDGIYSDGVIEHPTVLPDHWCGEWKEPTDGR